MKAITCDAILTSASTRADGSLGLRFSTPELKPEEKTVFFELLNMNLKMLLQPEGSGEVEMREVKAQFDYKTPSVRLRAVLFVLWKQSGEQGEFDDFYRHQMNVIIEETKSKLAPA